MLPVATSNECDVLFGGTGTKNFCALPKIVEPPGEAWSDLKIINELGKRIGPPGDFFDTDEEVLDYALAPSGVTWQELRTKIRRFQKTKIPRKDKSGFFTTPSGKVEMVSQKAVEEYGCDPMPTWKFLSDLPELTEEYPLLLTNYCDEEFRLSAFKQIKAFRKKKPFPTVQIGPDTAKKAGVKDGDWVYIETKLGRIVQKVVIDPELDPRVRPWRRLAGGSRRIRPIQVSGTSQISTFSLTIPKRKSQRVPWNFGASLAKYIRVRMCISMKAPCEMRLG